MSWTDVFPVLTDEMVDAYEAEASGAERRKHDRWFEVRRVENPRDVPHIVSTSLFWKNIREDLPEIVIRSRRSFMNAGRTRRVLRFNPWDHYVEPLLKGARDLHRKREDVAMRVYLASDLEFLIPDLVSVGCEVRLMATPSIRHNPGAMWRFLALEEDGKLKTNIDSDRAHLWKADVARTEEASALNLGWWRIPVWGEQNEIGTLSYRPIVGCQFGTSGSLEAERLMKALIWCTQKRKISTKGRPPGCGQVTVHGSAWPDYGFDEWFLQTTVYPRAAFDGMATFVPADAKSRLLPLDIEYVQWANPSSELVYFGSVPGCCPQPTRKLQESDGSKIEVSEEKHDIIAYTYRANCGLGEAAQRNIEAMRSLGLTVEHRYWDGNLIDEPALRNPEQIYYHHWHPQPPDKSRAWPKKLFGKAQHIAYWAYESDTPPPEFHPASKRMAELWVPSGYCKKIFDQLGRETFVIPHAVERVEPALRSLPGTKRSAPLTVLFLFDAWSRLPRKNPEAVIRVFRKAFAGDSRARLLIKAHHLSPEELSTLHAQCGRDHWITIINEFLSERELDTIFRSADILLSLQRSEGFGFNLARALANGLPLVTTGHGGHREFCKRANTFLVPYSMEEVAGYGDPWYPLGRWGAPNEGAAVKLLQKLAAMVRSRDPELDRMRQHGLDTMAKHFSTARLAQRIRGRLKHRLPSLSGRAPTT